MRCSEWEGPLVWCGSGADSKDHPPPSPVPHLPEKDVFFFNGFVVPFCLLVFSLWRRRRRRYDCRHRSAAGVQITGLFLMEDFEQILKFIFIRRVGCLYSLVILVRYTFQGFLYGG